MVIKIGMKEPVFASARLSKKADYLANAAVETALPCEYTAVNQYILTLWKDTNMFVSVSHLPY